MKIILNSTIAPSMLIIMSSICKEVISTQLMEYWRNHHRHKNRIAIGWTKIVCRKRRHRWKHTLHEAKPKHKLIPIP